MIKTLSAMFLALSLLAPQSTISSSHTPVTIIPALNMASLPRGDEKAEFIQSKKRTLYPLVAFNRTPQKAMLFETQLLTITKKEITDVIFS